MSRKKLDSAAGKVIFYLPRLTGDVIFDENGPPMKLVTLVAIFLALSLTSSCQSKKEKSFESEAKQLVDKINKQNRASAQEKLTSHDFSDGVQEVVEYYDYTDPLIDDYDIVTVGSTEELDALKKQNSDLKALYIDNYDTAINIGDISVFKNLEYLRVRSIDSLPTGFYQLKNLKAFVSSNDLNQKMDGRIRNLEDLEYFDSRFTELQLPPEISQLKKLRTLRFYNLDTEQPYADIYNIPNLKTLWLRFGSEKQLKGISRLAKLQILVTNALSAEVGDLNIKGLIISGNDDTLFPPELGRLKNLVAFKWQANYVATVAPRFVADLKGLEYIEFKGCTQFSSIPKEYVNLSNLKVFDIYYNDSYKKMEGHLEPLKDVIEIKNH